MCRPPLRSATVFGKTRQRLEVMHKNNNNNNNHNNNNRNNRNNNNCIKSEAREIPLRIEIVNVFRHHALH
jgi:hypothetical protein